PTAAPLKILSTGMVYDAELLRRFIVGLEEEAVAGRLAKTEFQLTGSEDFKPKMSPWPASARWLGWLERPALLEAMNEADLFYLQHPFDERQRDFSKTSFPAKLPGYLAARRPIVFHAPPYSSAAEFARMHGLPLWIGESDGKKAAQSFAEELKKIGSTSPWAQGYDAAVRAFDWKPIQGRFCETLRRLADS
ncbi:MAG TPA: hypothetical protein VD713_02420, partial [Sphingomonadales bacterium]|nr:hypothetical protein [Sphingomonadales bacterium]